MHNFHPWLRWLPAIALMAILFMFSSQSYQEQTLVPDIEKNTSTQSIADFFGEIRFSYGGHEISVASLGGASFVEFFIRKAAHFFSYALLASLLVYALGGPVRSGGRWSAAGRRNNAARRDVRARLLYAILLSFLYACSDELHQSLTPGRTALYQDVLLDTVGAACGAAFTILLIYWRNGRRHSRAS